MTSAYGAEVISFLRSEWDMEDMENVVEYCLHADGGNVFGMVL